LNNFYINFYRIHIEFDLYRFELHRFESNYTIIAVTYLTVVVTN
jgi:hypothetical protein